MKNKVFSSVLALLLMLLIVSAGIYGLNSFTAPIIAENRSAADFAPLMAVMPEAEGFEALYEATDVSASELSDVPGTVTGIYAESSGKGYAVKLSTTEGYTGEPMDLSFGVDAEGRICGISINAYNETKELGDEYTLSYIGQDSALGDVGLVSGATFSSTAFKNAVADGFEALIANNLVSAGVKSDAQLLMELLAEFNTGMVNPSGVLQYEELEASGSITQAFRALNGGSYAALVPYKEGSCLVTVNLSGAALAVNTVGELITEKLDGDLLDEVKAEAAKSLKSFAESDVKRLSRMVSDSAQFTEIPIDGVFNTLTTAFKVNDGAQEYLAFAARSYGYANEIMPVYCILDKDGAIVAVNTPELILHKEYFDGYTLDEGTYKEGLKGLSYDSFTGDETFISGATMSTDAMRTALDDIFSAYSIITEKGGADNE